jgi:hypothetical protein
MRNITLVLFLACSTALTTFAAPGLPVVSLKVTVNTTQQFSTPPGTPTDVLSDGHGQYIDGTNGVCASFDKQGDLIINFSCQSASPLRQLGLGSSLFLAPPTGDTNPPCLLPSSIVPGSSPSYTNNILTTQATSPMNTAAFQSMTVDSSGNTVYYVSFFIGTAFSNASQIRLNYHRTASTDFPTDAALASYAQVRRLSATEWVVESVTPSTLNGDPNVAMGVTVASTRHSSTSTECGFFQVPFSFTLDQK